MQNLDISQVVLEIFVPTATGPRPPVNPNPPSLGPVGSVAANQQPTIVLPDPRRTKLC